MINCQFLSPNLSVNLICTVLLLLFRNYPLFHDLLMQNKVVVFLHGFLGSGEDWVPIMKALSATTRCISIDLPGHGKSYIRRHNDNETKQELNISFEVMAELLHKLICSITPERVILAGYSMGARIALYMALRCNEKVCQLYIHFSFFFLFLTEDHFRTLKCLTKVITGYKDRRSCYNIRKSRFKGWGITEKSCCSRRCEGTVPCYAWFGKLSGHMVCRRTME